MYDIIIIGAGPAGLTAGIYASEANKRVLILEKMVEGGQVANINNITNYPGFESINGFDLSMAIKKQAKIAGAEIRREEVVAVDFSGDEKIVKTHKGEYMSRCVIIATGAYARSLDLQNEKEYLGKGVSYCATCDGNFFKNKTVAVVGGGNTSMDDCIYLSNLAKKIYLIHRREVFTATEKLVGKVKALQSELNNIEILTNSVVTKLNGGEKLDKITVLNKISGIEQELDVDGIFIAIGRKPDTAIFNGVIELENGFIKVNENMETNIPNVYAVGDVRVTPLRQIVTASSDGAIAVNNFLKK